MGGKTAETADYFHAVSASTPYVLIFVLGLRFLPLTLAFRSVVLAGLSIVLKLLSVGAGYGLLTLVFRPDRSSACAGTTVQHPPRRNGTLM